MVYTFVDILTEKLMETDKVKITAENIQKEIKEQGKIAIYETLFETGKATLLPSAANTINEMYTYIKANPTKNFYVVGHTDDTGNFEANMALSLQRAQSLTNELIKKRRTLATTYRQRRGTFDSGKHQQNRRGKTTQSPCGIG